MDRPADDAALQAARDRAVEAIASLSDQLAQIMAASESSNADDEHDPEGATIAFERAQVAALLGQAQGRLGAVDRALGDMGSGAYGRCVTCGDPIGAERLEARPDAQTCISCARRSTRGPQR
ncbi:MAG: TraR/DksA family transcriptional regulator [Frankiales bacterium]|nr:TraR/DksA family transcriptional regulator [Frankiales bacterium]